MAARHSHHSREPSPLALWHALVRPERTDIWVLCTFTCVIGLLMLATPIAVEALVNTVAFGNLLQPVIVLAILLFTCLGFMAGLQALQQYVAELMQRRMFVRVATLLALRIPLVDIRSMNARQSELVHRFYDLLTVLKVTAQLLLHGFFLIVQALLSMVVLAFYHPYLLGFDLVLIGTISFIVFVLGRGAVRTAIEESVVKYEIGGWLEAIARHPRAFKLAGAETLARGQAEELTEDYLSARARHFRIFLRQVLFSLGLQAIASTVLLGLGGWLVVSQQLTLGQLVASELLVSVIVSSFAKMGKHIESYYDLMAAVGKLHHLLDAPLEQASGGETLAAAGGRRVDLHGVSWNTGFGPVFDDLTLEIPAGARVGLIGPAGSGKSALLDMLFGLLPPSDGYLQIDGVDYRDLDRRELRRAAALAAEPEVVPGSVFENVALARPDVDLARVRAALDEVGLLETVLQMPEGLDTQLGEAPVFSRAQELALMLARAMAGQPSLLLIDGALDHLDEVQLDRALDAIFARERPWTVIVSTRRREVRQLCQYVLELPHGAIYPGDAMLRPPSNLAEVS